ncbi:phage baseplate assembly protein V [Ralstonia pseudosolanacearum]|uniref:phage baseplate assembly protein V n=1 Tax=Ralstonia solanacearum species complex TaxID=3116862 RepID=UPI0020034DCE|nr:phage baseplate assembly protein V [Ralstonia pseudosolanacearum]MCK4121410.1 phage baseplate assembly protein V [Ralstonia pseudosolanacearum]
MIAQLRNQMAMAAQLAQGARAESRAGEVKSYDPGTASARVRLLPIDPDNPDRSLTGWLPVTSPWVGNGWGIDAPVSPGDQVEIQFFGGEIDNGYICARLFSDEQRPTGAQSGEFFLTHASGSKLQFHNDGTVTLISAGTLTSQAPQWNHAGPVKIDGTLLVTHTITGQAGMAVSGNNGTGNSMSISGNTQFTGQVSANGHRIDETHQHTGVQSGGSNTGTVV